MPVEIVLEEGYRMRMECRNHVIISDQPLSGGGTDKGLTPVEIYASSLGSCVGVFIRSFAERHGIKTEGMKITVNFENREKPHRIGFVEVSVKMPEAVPEDKMAAIKRVAETCTVHNSMTHPAEIIVKFI